MEKLVPDNNKVSSAGLKNAIKNLENAKAKNLMMGGSEAITKQKSQGKLTVRERIELLADPGTFLEFGLLATHAPSNQSLSGKTTPCDGVVTGTCLIEGRPVAVAAYDFTVIAGTMGEVGERKVERMRKLAYDQRIPMVWLLDSAGARIQEIAGATFAGTGSLFYEQVALSGVVPQVAAVMGPTAAGSSYIATLADYTPMVKNYGTMSLAGPALVKAAVGEEISAQDLGGAKVHCEISGCADSQFEDDASCIAAIRKYLGFFPSHHREKFPLKRSGTPQNLKISDDILNILPEDPRRSFDMKKVINHLLDDGEFLEIKESFAKNIIVGLGRLMGSPMGLVANQSSTLGGAIDVNAADKATRFILTCNAFHIPLLFLHDCPGFLVGSHVEKQGILRHGAKFLHAVASLTIPRFSVIIRRSYGAGYYVMCGKGLKPDLIVGWPTAEVSLMGAEGAVSIITKNRNHRNSSSQIEKYRSGIGVFQAAELGHIDDIIDPRQTRAILFKALQFTIHKRTRNLRIKRQGISPV